MKISYNWLQEYFQDPLPSAGEVRLLLENHAWEVEGIEEISGDTIFDIDVLPNRAADSLSHRGVARELSVLLGVDMEKDPLRDEFLEYSENGELSILVDEGISDTRVTAAYVTGVKVSESPKWLKDKLELFGQRSINNIVDATNYVMLNMGQPLHAFDARAFSGSDKQVRIKYAKDGEKLELLGGVVVELSKNDLVVSDGATGSALDVAGIRGGSGAEVGAETTAIVLTSSHFDPVLVRKTSQRLKLWTDASTRLQNNPSSHLADHGLREGLELILDIAGGKTMDIVAGGAVLEQAQYVGTSLSEINNLLGLELNQDDVDGILSRWNVAHKHIVPREALESLIEETKDIPYKYGAAFRYEGQGCFDCSSFVRFLYFKSGIALPRVSADQFLYTKRIKENELVFGDLVFSKSSIEKNNRDVSVVFRAGTKLDVSVGHVGMYVGEGRVVHTSSETKKVVIESLKDSVDFKDISGYGRVIEDLSLSRIVVEIPFERKDINISADIIEEIGRVYGYDKLPYSPLAVLDGGVDAPLYLVEERMREVLLGLGLSEVYTYSLTGTGKRKLLNALNTQKNHLRESLVLGLSEALEYNVKQKPLLGMEQIMLFEIGSVFSADVEKRFCGIAISQKKKGKFFESVLSELKEVFGMDMVHAEKDGVLEISLEELVDADISLGAYSPLGGDMFKIPSTYPFASRDVAVWTPEGTESQAVEEIIVREAGNLLYRFDLFDTYTKDGRTSYAYHLVFQSLDRTLTDVEVDEKMKSVYDALGEIKGFEIR